MEQALKLLDEKQVRKVEEAVSDLEKKIRQKRTLMKRNLEDFYQEK